MKLKQEKGSVTLFVLVSLLFFVLFLSGMYLLSSSREQTGYVETAKVKEIYESDVSRADDVYETLIKVRDTNTSKIPLESKLGIEEVMVNGKKLAKGWRYFCTEGDNIVFIYEDYMPVENLTITGSTIKTNEHIIYIQTVIEQIY